ncbi:MAG: pantoate--beta-alanine ligase [Deltaproteobacteria bacterium]|nr:pantoate--beta-alanine ligase [Deltaproteobacteria bacterium]
METISSCREMQRYSNKKRNSGESIVLVPTMGSLHEGHLSLIRLGRQRCDILVVSIFVNPTQFSPTEDFNAYPRDFSRDSELCRSLGVDVIYYPSVEEIYPKGFQTFIEVEELSKPLCGISRPHFFRGVATVCAKLFNIVKPHMAVFGEKDYQQLLIIRRMVKDLNMDIKIISAPLIREKDGLAMSSRNAYLNPAERKAALCLNHGLSEACVLFRKGWRDASAIIRRVRNIMEAEPLVRIDYVEIRDKETLAPVTTIERPVVLALAAYAGKTRLIDNCLLDE